jgi:endonuclease III-like uncharacterized protein
MTRIEDEIVADLIVALLTVNQWTVGQAAALLSSLRSNGLLDLSSIHRLSQDDIATRLAASGYQRGGFMCRLMADRIRCVAEALRAGTLETLLKCEQSDDRDGMTRCLLPLKGVGPQVVAVFLALRDDRAD